MKIISVRAVFIIALYGSSNICSQDIQLLNLVVFDSVLLHGCYEKGTIIQWKFNDDFLFIDNNLIGKGSSKSIQLLPNKSVHIEHVSVDHGGTYQCICGSSSVISYYIEVEVPPRLTIAANEQRSTKNGSIIFLPRNAVSLVFCFVIECRPEVNLTLMIDDAFTATSGQTTITGSGHNETFSTTVNVRKPVTGDDGSISCESNGLGTNSAARLNVLYLSYVPPRMSILFDDTEIDQSHRWVLSNKTTKITCVASESRPLVNLSWIINDVTLNVTTQTNVGNHDNATFNSSTTLFYAPERQVENISCVASGVGSMRYKKYVSLFTYDLPVLHLSFERQSYETKVNERPEVERWRVTCYAMGGTPKAELMFHERFENVIELPPNETTSAISILTERLATSDPEIITCTSIQQLNDSDVIINISRVLETLHEETTSYPDQTYAATVVSLPFNLNKIQPLAIITAAAILCVVVLCTYVAILKKRSSMSANLSSSEDQNLRRPSHIQMADLPQTDQSPLKEPLQGSLREKAKSDLPSIPSENNSVNSNGSESNYYSAAKEGVEKERLFSEKDFCLLLSIRSGSIYKRWMGTITLSSTVNKCAVLITMADMVTKKKVIQWESFVKRTLDLPKCDHITNIEGIGVDTTTLYLITEHVVCETMDNQLTCDPDSIGTKAPMTVPDVMKHISGILEGMELIESYGFLHPGLSTKKVLYTKNGICKLYDFCLAEDAPKIVTLKKEQMSSFNLNQFPPESLFRNEYTSESDVWSTAVVIWEILSSGMPPFPIDGEVKAGEDIQPPTLTWPQRYLQLRNLTLFECWNQDCSLRPSIRQLRASFKSIFETLIENSLYEIPLSGLYTPMKGTTV